MLRFISINSHWICEASTVLSVEDAILNKTNVDPALMELTVYQERPT